MNVFRIVMYVLAGLIAIGLAGYLAYARDRRQSGSRLSSSLQRLEDGYVNFVRHRFSQGILAENNMAVYGDELIKDVMPVLEPHINALIAGINGNAVKDTPVKVHSDSFANVAAMVEWLNQARSEQKTPLTEDQENQLRGSLQIAIRADIIQRKMKLESGKL